MTVAVKGDAVLDAAVAVAVKGDAVLDAAVVVAVENAVLDAAVPVAVKGDAVLDAAVVGAVENAVLDAAVAVAVKDDAVLDAAVVVAVENAVLDAAVAVAVWGNAALVAAVPGLECDAVALAETYKAVDFVVVAPVAVLDVAGEGNYDQHRLPPSLPHLLPHLHLQDSPAQSHEPQQDVSWEWNWRQRPADRCDTAGAARDLCEHLWHAWQAHKFVTGLWSRRDSSMLCC